MGLFSDLFKKLANEKRSVFNTQKSVVEQKQKQAATAPKEVDDDLKGNCPFTPDIK